MLGSYRRTCGSNRSRPGQILRSRSVYICGAGQGGSTFYTWRAKYSGLEVSDVQRLRQLEDENRRLKQMVADQAVDIQALKAINAKNW